MECEYVNRPHFPGWWDHKYRHQPADSVIYVRESPPQYDAGHRSVRWWLSMGIPEATTPGVSTAHKPETNRVRCFDRIVCCVPADDRIPDGSGAGDRMDVQRIPAGSDRERMGNQSDHDGAVVCDGVLHRSAVLVRPSGNQFQRIKHDDPWRRGARSSRCPRYSVHFTTCTAWARACTCRC